MKKIPKILISMISSPYSKNKFEIKNIVSIWNDVFLLSYNGNERSDVMDNSIYNGCNRNDDRNHQDRVRNEKMHNDKMNNDCMHLHDMNGCFNGVHHHNDDCNCNNCSSWVGFLFAALILFVIRRY